MSACDDISEFLEILKQMRVVDDKIVHALNTTIPTESFADKVNGKETCKNLFTQLVASHANRQDQLNNCLSITAQKLQSLKKQKNAAPDDVQILKSLRREQTKMRELQTEVNVEEVIRGRTLKIYNEKCRFFYKSPEAVSSV